MFIRWPNSHHRSVRLTISIFDCLEFLEQPEENIAALCVDHDLSWTDSRPSPKRYEVPQWSSCLPSLRTEFFGILAPHIWIAMHYVSIAMYDVTLRAKDRCVAVGAATCRQGRVFDTSANGLKADRI